MGKYLIVMPACMERSQGIEFQDLDPNAIAAVHIIRIGLEDLNTAAASPLLTAWPLKINKLQPPTIKLIIIHNIIKLGYSHWEISILP